MMVSRVHSINGVTIIELQAVIIIVAIVITIVISMVNLVHRYQIEALSNHAYSHIVLARSEAMKRNQIVSVCPSNNGENCNSTNWQDGWLVFTNADNDNVINNDDTILQIKQEIQPNLNINSGGANQIDFLANGSSPTAAELVICRSRETNGLINRITVNNSGQIIRSSEFGNCN